MNNEKTFAFVKVTENPVEDFLKRFFLSDMELLNLIIITPIMGSLSGRRFSVERLKEKIDTERIPTYIITREPQDDFHIEAINILMDSDFVEVRYNNSLHAKLYICMGRDSGFALLGSGNLTQTSIEKNIEIGMLIFHHDKGKQILRELYHWGSVRLRTLKESKVVKRITYERR